MDRRTWTSSRALKLHAVVLIVVPSFLALCVWQIERALGGNTLSWAYVFEWPLFAGYAVYMWWRLVHEVPDGSPAAVAAERAVGAASPSVAPDLDRLRVGEPEEEDQDLAAYNAYLARLAQRDEAAQQGHGR